MSTDNAGGVVLRDGRRVLRFERVLDVPVEAVWRVLTVPERVSAWLADVEELDLVVGGRVALRCPTTDGAGARGSVTAHEPTRVLEFDTDLYGRLRWELTGVAGGARLLFTVDQDVPDDQVTRMLANWHVHLDFLTEALAGARVDWDDFPLHRWESYVDSYRAALG
ncbi:SRPBCC domain-containing protein [Actinosynnema sp. NPDC020468]|uniref:SRPBCC domain-containing protein n=1 Tax=Actinosynnema sp. NPDC020468 TaxID=3154488 RepID=UPI0033C46773